MLAVLYHAPGRMSPITHFLMGWTGANTSPSLTKRERTFVTLASVVPDLDGLGIIAEKRHICAGCHCELCSLVMTSRFKNTKKQQRERRQPLPLALQTVSNCQLFL